MKDNKSSSQQAETVQQRDIQVDRLADMLNEPKTNDPRVKDDIDKRNGMLGRMFTAVELGDLQINGQQPDQDYQLAEYMIHGGRILFDLSDLSPQEQKEFKVWLKGDAPIQQRVSATHAIGTNSQNQPIDVKTSPISAMASGVIAKAKGKPTHFGMDVHAGGYGATITNYEGKTKTVKADGGFGHLYINDDPDHPEAIQMGFEEAGALKTNQYTGDYHSATGGGGKYSAFGASRLGKVDENDSRAPLILPESRTKDAKYNWNRVKITPEEFEEMKKATTDNTEIQKKLKSPHPNSVKVTNANERMEDMADFRKGTSKTAANSTAESLSESSERKTSSDLSRGRQEETASDSDSPLESITNSSFGELVNLSASQEDDYSDDDGQVEKLSSAQTGDLMRTSSSQDDDYSDDLIPLDNLSSMSSGELSSSSASQDEELYDLLDEGSETEDSTSQKDSDDEEGEGEDSGENIRL